MTDIEKSLEGYLSEYLSKTGKQNAARAAYKATLRRVLKEVRVRLTTPEMRNGRWRFPDIDKTINQMIEELENTDDCPD